MFYFEAFVIFSYVLYDRQIIKSRRSLWAKIFTFSSLTSCYTYTDTSFCSLYSR